jgi:membrane protease YdiL (CAAX protease family)
MSAPLARIDARIETVPATFLDGAAVAAALGLLSVRPSVASLPLAPVLLVTLYAAVLHVSWDGRAALGSARRMWPVVAVGVSAVAISRVAVEAGSPAPRTAWVVPLGIAAAIAEEAFFRGLLYRFLSRGGAGVAVLGTAVAFAALHVPAYGPAAFWVDLGGGLLLSWQRWASGGWMAPATTHVVANVLAVMP